MEKSQQDKEVFKSIVISGTGYWRVNRGYPYGGDFCRTDREKDTEVIVLSSYSHNESKVQFPNGDIGVVQNRYFRPAHQATVLP